MINKIHFGKRMASHRKMMHLSQTQLSEMLGVTPQAVSKWECGTAIPDLDILLELSRLYKITINDMLEDSDIITKLVNRSYEQDDIAYFTSIDETPYNLEWVDEIIKGGWVKRNYDNSKENNQTRDEIGKVIAGHGGIILEIGAGPGGGFMLYVLKSNPDAAIIISDLSPTVVREWKRVLDCELDSPELSYAVFNFCDIPFKDNTIDVISDGGGIGNTESGTKQAALKEVYRVLKPGGLFVTSTGFVNKETLAGLPENAVRILKEKQPDIFEDLYEETMLAGFKKIDSIITGTWDTDHDDSTIAYLAHSLCVNLIFTSYVRHCRK